MLFLILFDSQGLWLRDLPAGKYGNAIYISSIHYPVIIKL
jgi:hypothetical protein